MKDEALLFFICFGLVLLWLWWSSSRPVNEPKKYITKLRRKVLLAHGLQGFKYEHMEIEHFDFVFARERLELEGWVEYYG